MRRGVGAINVNMAEFVKKSRVLGALIVLELLRSNCSLPRHSEALPQKDRILLIWHNYRLPGCEVSSGCVFPNMAEDRGATHRLATISGHLTKTTRCPEPKVSQTAVLSSGAYKEEHLVLPNDILSPDEVEFYNKNGFFVVRNLVSQEDLNIYYERFRQICMKEVKIPGLLVMKDVSLVKSEFLANERAVNKIQDYQNDDVLFSYCELPEILKYVACFTGPDITAVHTMLINKPPDAGTKSSRHPLHQDLHYFPFRPANRMVCSWTAMEKVHRDNGCLVVLPGTHHGELLQHVYPQWQVRISSWVPHHFPIAPKKGANFKTNGAIVRLLKT